MTKFDISADRYDNGFYFDIGELKKQISIPQCRDKEVLTIAYEKAYLGDISILMITRKTNDGGMEIVKVFTEEEADSMYAKLTDK